MRGNHFYTIQKSINGLEEVAVSTNVRNALRCIPKDALFTLFSLNERQNDQNCSLPRFRPSTWSNSVSDTLGSDTRSALRRLFPFSRISGSAADLPRANRNIFAKKAASRARFPSASVFASK